MIVGVMVVNSGLLVAIKGQGSKSGYPQHPTPTPYPPHHRPQEQNSIIFLTLYSRLPSGCPHRGARNTQRRHPILPITLPQEQTSIIFLTLYSPILPITLPQEQTSIIFLTLYSQPAPGPYPAKVTQQLAV
jgi:hypothetical protein